MTGTTDVDTVSSPASTAATALLSELVVLGVRHVVVSPGSRSQALALAAARLEREGRLRLHVRIDERVGGFTALGIARESAVPAAIVCTSGTAVANLLPAVMEAHHAGVPLILLTADRPPELRGIGANQTTVQPDLFRPFVRLAVETETPSGEDGEVEAMRAVAATAYAHAMGEDDVPGPVHLNLPYREPLSGGVAAGSDAEADAAPDETWGATRRVDDEPPVVLPRGPRTIVVAGEGAGPDAEDIAFRGGWPLVAEIVSGARFGRNLVHGYRAALRDPALGGRVERVVVLGHPTLSREVSTLLSRDGVAVIAVRRGGEALDLNGTTSEAWSVAIEDGEADRTWLGEWLRFSRAAAPDLDAPPPDLDALASTDPRTRAGAVRAELDAVRRPLDREQLVAAVWAATWPHDRLVFASSRLVRVADEVLPGKKLRVHANRGLAGIDGTVSTAMGVALAGVPGFTRVLIGDLALLHDAGALLLPDGEGAPRVQLVVGNDGGGTIFDGLEVASVAPEADMTRVQYTPQSVDLASLAAAYGWEHVRVTDRGALDQALTAATAPRTVIEVPLPR